MSDDNQNGWRLDRRIPIASFGAVLLWMFTQGAAMVWWEAKVDGRLGLLESEAVINKLSRDKVIDLTAEISSIKNTLADIKENDLGDIKKTLDHLVWEKHNETARKEGR